jgi:glyceraldehyde-3-phosphate dehydrogenase (NAD(P))
MTKKTIVHVVGTGTIGEPLIGLFSEFKERWGIDEVTFHKRTPRLPDRAKVEVSSARRLARRRR